jgi:hypothetical protein
MKKALNGGLGMLKNGNLSPANKEKMSHFLKNKDGKKIIERIQMGSPSLALSKKKCADRTTFVTVTAEQDGATMLLDIGTAEFQADKVVDELSKTNAVMASVSAFLGASALLLF